VAGRRAWRLGQAGIAEEAETHHKSPRYFWALCLGLARDAAVSHLERMKI
jgi:hypothetical protein